MEGDETDIKRGKTWARPVAGEDREEEQHGREIVESELVGLGDWWAGERREVEWGVKVNLHISNLGTFNWGGEYRRELEAWMAG